MTPREQVIATLEHIQTPTAPYAAWFTQQAAENMKAYLNKEDFSADFGLSLADFNYWGNHKELPDRPEYFIDDFGIIWNRTGADKDIGVIENVMIPSLEEGFTYQFPEIDEQYFRDLCQNLVDNAGDRFSIAGIGFTMFERSWSLMGMEELLMSMILCPEELHKLYDAICEHHLKIIDIMIQYPVDGIYFGDDWGQQKGLIMGRDHWVEFIKPRMKRLYDRAHSAGKYVFQHSCGDCSEIMEDLIEIGLNCYQTFQPEIYDIQKMKDLHGDRLSFWGGISTQQLLPHADAATVKAETTRILDIMRVNGGYIAAPTHAVEFDVPPENIMAMMEAFQQQKPMI